jgi:hypothetical protein
VTLAAVQEHGSKDDPNYERDFHPGAGGHGSIGGLPVHGVESLTDRQMERLRAGLERLPLVDRQLLASMGVTVTVEMAPRMMGPAQWEPESLTIRVPGDGVFAIEHEAGHAMDWALGGVSSRPEWQFLVRREKVPAIRGLHYKNSRASEAWADAYSAAYGGQHPMWLDPGSVLIRIAREMPRAPFREHGSKDDPNYWKYHPDTAVPAGTSRAAYEQLDAMIHAAGFENVRIGDGLSSLGPVLQRGPNGEPVVMDKVEQKFAFPKPDPSTARPPKYLWRAITEESWQRTLKEGAYKSQGRLNLYASEGTVTAWNTIPTFYLPGRLYSDPPGDYIGRIIRITYDPADGWKMDPKGDEYIKTQQPIPLSRITWTTPPIVTRKYGESKIEDMFLLDEPLKEHGDPDVDADYYTRLHPERAPGVQQPTQGAASVLAPGTFAELEPEQRAVVEREAQRLAAMGFSKQVEATRVADVGSDTKKVNGSWAVLQGVMTLSANPTYAGYSSSRDIGDTFRHEYGHAIWPTIPKAQRQLIEDTLHNWLQEQSAESITSQLSKYALNDYLDSNDGFRVAGDNEEVWAEVFSITTRSDYKLGTLPFDAEVWDALLAVQTREHGDPTRDVDYYTRFHPERTRVVMVDRLDGALARYDEGAHTIYVTKGVDAHELAHEFGHGWEAQFQHQMVDSEYNAGLGYYDHEKGKFIVGESVYEVRLTKTGEVKRFASSAEENAFLSGLPLGTGYKVFNRAAREYRSPSEAAADSFAYYVHQPDRLDPSVRQWVEARLTPEWLKMVDRLRSKPSPADWITSPLTEHGDPDTDPDYYTTYHPERFKGLIGGDPSNLSRKGRAMVMAEALRLSEMGYRVPVVMDGKPAQEGVNGEYIPQGEPGVYDERTWAPPIIRFREDGFTTGYSASRNVGEAFRHEYAHALQDTLGADSNKPIEVIERWMSWQDWDEGKKRTWLLQNLSQYAMEDREWEMVAEAFLRITAPDYKPGTFEFDADLLAALRLKAGQHMREHGDPEKDPDYYTAFHPGGYPGDKLHATGLFLEDEPFDRLLPETREQVLRGAKRLREFGFEHPVRYTDKFDGGSVFGEYLDLGPEGGQINLNAKTFAELGGYDHMIARDYGDVFRHEYAHALWFEALDNAARSKWRQTLQQWDVAIGRDAMIATLSSYASTSSVEMVAEVFTKITDEDYVPGTIPFDAAMLADFLAAARSAPPRDQAGAPVREHGDPDSMPPDEYAKYHPEAEGVAYGTGLFGEERPFWLLATRKRREVLKEAGRLAAMGFQAHVPKTEVLQAGIHKDAGLWRPDGTIALNPSPSRTGYNAARSVGDTFRHEYGHTLWEALSPQARATITTAFTTWAVRVGYDEITRLISQYAADGVLEQALSGRWRPIKGAGATGYQEEFWAEAFAVMTHPAYQSGTLPFDGVVWEALRAGGVLVDRMREHGDPITSMNYERDFHPGWGKHGPAGFALPEERPIIERQMKRMDEMFGVPVHVDDTQRISTSKELLGKYISERGGDVFEEGEWKPGYVFVQSGINHKTGWAFGDDIGDTFRHEYAHALIDRIDVDRRGSVLDFVQSFDPDWRKNADWLRRNVSAYAADFGSWEAFAETFALITDEHYTAGAIPFDGDMLAALRKALEASGTDLKEHGDPDTTPPAEYKKMHPGSKRIRHTPTGAHDPFTEFEMEMDAAKQARADGINARVAEFRAKGGVIENEPEHGVGSDAILDMMAADMGESWAQSRGTQFTRQAIERGRKTRREKPDLVSGVLTAWTTDPATGYGDHVAGALNYFVMDEFRIPFGKTYKRRYVYADYVGSTGILPGVGSALMREVILIAAKMNLPVLGTADPPALSYWRDVWGWQRNPFNFDLGGTASRMSGSDSLYGLTAQQVKDLAKRLKGEGSLVNAHFAEIAAEVEQYDPDAAPWRDTWLTLLREHGDKDRMTPEEYAKYHPGTGHGGTSLILKIDEAQFTSGQVHDLYADAARLESMGYQMPVRVFAVAGHREKEVLGEFGRNFNRDGEWMPGTVYLNPGAWHKGWWNPDGYTSSRVLTDVFRHEYAHALIYRAGGDEFAERLLRRFRRLIGMYVGGSSHSAAAKQWILERMGPYAAESMFRRRKRWEGPPGEEMLADAFAVITRPGYEPGTIPFDDELLGALKQHAGPWEQPVEEHGDPDTTPPAEYAQMHPGGRHAAGEHEAVAAFERKWMGIDSKVEVFLVVDDDGTPLAQGTGGKTGVTTEVIDKSLLTPGRLLTHLHPKPNYSEATHLSLGDLDTALKYGITMRAFQANGTWEQFEPTPSKYRRGFDYSVREINRKARERAEKNGTDPTDERDALLIKYASDRGTFTSGVITREHGDKDDPQYAALFHPGWAANPVVPAGTIPPGPTWVPQAVADAGFKDGRVNGQLVRGEEIIAPDDERIPDTVYHVTTNLPAVRSSGYLRPSGEGGLGGDSWDRLVSMTIDRGIAEQLAKDIRLNAEAYRTPLDDLPGFLTEQARREGWVDKWLAAPYFADGKPVPTGYSAHDWMTAYFNARDFRAGIRNPMFFGEGGATTDPANVGIIAIPKANLNNGSLLVAFDLTNPFGLQEIRSYGAVPLTDAEFMEHGDKNDPEYEALYHPGYALERIPKGLTNTELAQRLDALPDEAVLAFYHGTTVEAARKIVAEKRLKPDDLNSVGLATDWWVAKGYGGYKTPGKGVVVEVLVRRGDLGWANWHYPEGGWPRILVDRPAVTPERYFGEETGGGGYDSILVSEHRRWDGLHLIDARISRAPARVREHGDPDTTPPDEYAQMHPGGRSATSATTILPADAFAELKPEWRAEIEREAARLHAMGYHRKVAKAKVIIPGTRVDHPSGLIAYEGRRVPSPFWMEIAPENLSLGAALGDEVWLNSIWTANGYSAARSIGDTFRHEYGHVLWAYMPPEYRQRVTDMVLGWAGYVPEGNEDAGLFDMEMVETAVSRYAADSIMEGVHYEAVAEFFSLITGADYKPGTYHFDAEFMALFREVGSFAGLSQMYEGALREHGTKGAPGYERYHPNSDDTGSRFEGQTGRLDKRRLGRCYELAGSRLIQEGLRGAGAEGMRLVHGTIQGFNYPRIKHAWVIQPDGMIWEPISEVTYPRIAFDALYKPTYDLEYDYVTAAKHMVKTGHWGPWADYAPLIEHGDKGRPDYWRYHPGTDLIDFKQRYDYRGMANPPGPTTGEPSMNELPADDWHRRYLYERAARGDALPAGWDPDAVYGPIDVARADKNALITVYRGVPGDIDAIQPGDWVTQVRDYAATYGERVVETRVPASQLYLAPTMNIPVEWVWVPSAHFHRLARAAPFYRLDQMTEHGDKSDPYYGVKFHPGPAGGKAQDLWSVNYVAIQTAARNGKPSWLPWVNESIAGLDAAMRPTTEPMDVRRFTGPEQLGFPDIEIRAPRTDLPATDDLLTEFAGLRPGDAWTEQTYDSLQPFFGQSPLDAFRDRLIGRTFTDPGYMATTLFEDITWQRDSEGNFGSPHMYPIRLDLHVPAGTMAVDISPFSRLNEREWLLARGTSFRVTGIERTTKRDEWSQQRYPYWIVKAEVLPDQVREHGTKGEPGYEKYHPRSSEPFTSPEQLVNVVEHGDPDRDPDYYTNFHPRRDLTSAERNELSTYSGYAYEEINGYLRGTYEPPATPAGFLGQERPGRFAKDSLDPMIARLDAALAASPLPEDATLYRVLRLDTATRALFGDYTKVSDLIGRSGVDPAYLSTSTDPNILGHIGVRQSRLLELRVPAGIHAATLGDLARSRGESEVLLERGLTLTVRAIKGQTLVVDVSRGHMREHGDPARDEDYYTRLHPKATFRPGWDDVPYRAPDDGRPTPLTALPMSDQPPRSPDDFGNRLHIVDKVHGKPNELVTIYRGEERTTKHIRPGDWVTPNDGYARMYAPGGNVLKMRVPAGELYGGAGWNAMEWAWWPPGYFREHGDPERDADYDPPLITVEVRQPTVHREHGDPDTTPPDEYAQMHPDSKSKPYMGSARKRVNKWDYPAKLPEPAYTAADDAAFYSEVSGGVKVEGPPGEAVVKYQQGVPAAVAMYDDDGRVVAVVGFTYGYIGKGALPDGISLVMVRPSARRQGWGFRLYDYIQDHTDVNLYDAIGGALTARGKVFALGWLNHRVAIERARDPEFAEAAAKSGLRAAIERVTAAPVSDGGAEVDPEEPLAPVREHGDKSDPNYERDFHPGGASGLMVEAEPFKNLTPEERATVLAEAERLHAMGFSEKVQRTAANFDDPRTRGYYRPAYREMGLLSNGVYDRYSASQTIADDFRHEYGHVLWEGLGWATGRWDVVGIGAKAAMTAEDMAALIAGANFAIGLKSRISEAIRAWAEPLGRMGQTAAISRYFADGFGGLLPSGDTEAFAEVFSVITQPGYVPGTLPFDQAIWDTLVEGGLLPGHQMPLPLQEHGTKGKPGYEEWFHPGTSLPGNDDDRPGQPRRPLHDYSATDEAFYATGLFSRSDVPFERLSDARRADILAGAQRLQELGFGQRVPGTAAIDDPATYGRYDYGVIGISERAFRTVQHEGMSIDAYAGVRNYADVFRHEYAHMLNLSLMDQSQRKRVAQAYRWWLGMLGTDEDERYDKVQKYISSYAAADNGGSEAFADAFAVITNPNYKMGTLPFDREFLDVFLEAGRGQSPFAEHGDPDSMPRAEYEALYHPGYGLPVAQMYQHFPPDQKEAALMALSTDLFRQGAIFIGLTEEEHRRVREEAMRLHDMGFRTRIQDTGTKGFESSTANGEFQRRIDKVLLRSGGDHSNGFSASRDIGDDFRHEYAHVLWFSMNSNVRIGFGEEIKEWADGLGDHGLAAVSGYFAWAHSNPNFHASKAEQFAEVFSIITRPDYKPGTFPFDATFISRILNDPNLKQDAEYDALAFAEFVKRYNAAHVKEHGSPAVNPDYYTKFHPKRGTVPAFERVAGTRGATRWNPANGLEWIDEAYAKAGVKPGTEPNTGDLLPYDHFGTPSTLIPYRGPDGRRVGYVLHAETALAYDSATNWVKRVPSPSILSVGVEPSLRGKGFGMAMYDWVQDHTPINLYEAIGQNNDLTPAGKAFALAWLRHRAEMEGVTLAPVSSALPPIPVATGNPNEIGYDD